MNNKDNDGYDLSAKRWDLESDVLWAMRIKGEDAIFYRRRPNWNRTGCPTLFKVN